MPQRGRPPLSRGVLSFEGDTPPPSELILDSSFVVHALMNREPHHAAARAFIELMAEAGTTVVFNRLLELELREVAFRAPLIERYPKDWRRRRHDKRSLRRASRLIGVTMSAWMELLTAFDYLRVELHEVADIVDEFMDRYGLSSYDAVHVATAQFAGVPRLITTDTDFSAVPEDRLTLLVNESRVGRCRQIRAGMRG